MKEEKDAKEAQEEINKKKSLDQRIKMLEKIIDDFYNDIEKLNLSEEKIISHAIETKCKIDNQHRRITDIAKELEILKYIYCYI